ncbi:MAG: DUF885 family protein [Vicinamibacterales bacterium]
MSPATPAAALDRFFAAFYRRRPVAATFTGLHADDHRLPDWSAEGLAAEVQETVELRAELAAAGRVADAQAMRFPDQVDLALADAQLEIAQAEHDCGHFVHRNPSLWTGEAIFGVLSLVTRDFAPLPDRLEAARQRLDAIPAFLATLPATMKEAPLDWQGRAKRECQTAMRLFGETLPDWVATRHPMAASGFRAAARRAAEGFERLERWLGPVGPTAGPLSFLRRRLATAPAERESAGGDLLRLLLARGHFVTTPIDDLLREATDTLDEATARLAEASAPHGGWPAVQERLAAHHAPADEYLSCLERKWQACKAAADAADLVTWPDAPLRYVEVPVHTRDAAPHLYYLNYRSPAPFDPFGVFEYVVPPITGLPTDQVEAKLRGMNHSVMMLNHVVHHGAIGHHVQNHHAYRGASRIGRVAAVDTANRIAMFGGGSLAEGWACYACDLMEEVGFLKPLERIAQQHTRVRIAARAVVDLSIHTGRMTVPQAAWLYEDRAHMAQAAAKAEAVRNSMFPGTAVMYWLGTRGIHQLRAEVSAREGAAFSRRRFHDRVLSYGAIPVALIARLMAEVPR